MIHQNYAPLRHFSLLDQCIYDTLKIQTLVSSPIRCIISSNFSSTHRSLIQLQWLIWDSQNQYFDQQQFHHFCILHNSPRLPKILTKVFESNLKSCFVEQGEQFVFLNFFILLGFASVWLRVRRNISVIYGI